MVSKPFQSEYRINLWPDKVKKAVIYESMNHCIEIQTKRKYKSVAVYVKNKRTKEFDSIIEDVWRWYREQPDYTKETIKYDTTMFLKNHILCIVHEEHGITDAYGQYGIFA